MTREAQTATVEGDTAHSTHTPGDWTDLPDPDEGGRMVMAGDYIVATVHDGLPEGQCEANARLIFAAPDMYEALPDLIECAEILAAQCRAAGDEAHANMYQARAERGRAALSKSEGRS